MRPPGERCDKTKQYNINKQNATKRKERTETSKHNKSTFEAPAEVCGASSISRFYLLRSRSGTLPPCLPSPSCFHFVNRGFPTTATRPVPIPLDATRNGSATLPVQFRLIVVRWVVLVVVGPTSPRTIRYTQQTTYLPTHTHLPIPTQPPCKVATPTCIA